MGKLKALLLVLIVWSGFFASLVSADLSCDNRYLTIVNPIRSRKLWSDPSLQNLDDLYSPIKLNNFSASWLLQYDVFNDSELMNHLKNFDEKQEFGVLLEVSPGLASQARVIYPYDAAWFSPRAVFLSGYSRSDRKRLIDSLFEKYHQTFHQYPQSVGAWWVDSYSLDYLKQRYDIKTVLIVADQKTTDHYGVWGQWWGVPYYPSKINILVPASELSNQQNVAVIQWALRDPERAFGDGPGFSNYSLQANDYTEQGLDTNYFKSLASDYLDCKNQLGQITVGLEVGQESIGNSAEYFKQLNFLKTWPGLQSLTMSQFFTKFSSVYSSNPPQVQISGDRSTWVMTPSFRQNIFLGEKINYNPGLSFSDYFVADGSDFLNRKLDLLDQRNSGSDFPFYLIVVVGLYFYALKFRQVRVWILSLAVSSLSYGWLLRSSIQNGWVVFYGGKVDNLGLYQSLVIVGWFVWLSVLKKVRSFQPWYLVLSFGFDWLISLPRYSYISGKYYLGLNWDALRFVGISLNKSSVNLVNQDFPAYQAAAWLRFDFNRVWDHWYLAFLIYPITHILIAWVLSLSLPRFGIKLQKIIVLFLLICVIAWAFTLITSDPRMVV